jgi:hypothetical protein
MCGEWFPSRQSEAVSLDEHAVIPGLGLGEETNEDKGDTE